MKTSPHSVLRGSCRCAGGTHHRMLCTRRLSKRQSPRGFGAQIAEVSGSKQIAQVGSTLPQPVVVQVNGADGNGVTGALVTFHGEGMQFTPAQALTDSSGQVTTNVQMGFNNGDYQMIAETPKAGGGSAHLRCARLLLVTNRRWARR